MDLQSYLDTHQLSAAGFARLIEVDTATVLRIKQRKVVPHRRTLVRILEATNGEVTVCDLLDIVELCPARTCVSHVMKARKECLSNGSK